MTPTNSLFCMVIFISIISRFPKRHLINSFFFYYMYPVHTQSTIHEHDEKKTCIWSFSIVLLLSITSRNTIRHYISWCNWPYDICLYVPLFCFVYDYYLLMTVSMCSCVTLNWWCTYIVHPDRLPCIYRIYVQCFNVSC